MSDAFRRLRCALADRPRCVVVHGPSGVGKSSVVREVLDSICASGVGKAYVRFEPVDAEGFLDGTEPDKAFRRWVEANVESKEERVGKMKDDCALYLVVDDACLWFGTEMGKSRSRGNGQHAHQLILTLSDVVCSLAAGVTMLLIVENEPDLHPFVKRNVDEWVAVDIPDADTRLKVWRSCILPRGLASPDHRACLAQVSSRCHGWVLSDIVDVCYNFAAGKSDGDSCSLSVEQAKCLFASLELAVDKHVPLLFRGGEGGTSCPWTLIPSHAVSTTWQSIGGLEETKQTLKEVVVWPMVHAAEFASLGVSRPPSGVLLYGPPGTGKTLLASAVAKESAANFMTISIGDIIRGHVGESERLLARVFAMARSVAPCVLFFDEFQALFGRRDGDGAGNVGRKLVAQFLLETDRATPGLFLLAATNVPDAIDPALLRPGRFDHKILVPLPDEQGRRMILARLRQQMGSWAEDVDMDVIVTGTEGFSGAEIDALCQRAALLAVEQDQSKVTTANFADIFQ